MSVLNDGYSYKNAKYFSLPHKTIKMQSNLAFLVKYFYAPCVSFNQDHILDLVVNFDLSFWFC
jgi:hypothetical protein